MLSKRLSLLVLLVFALANSEIGLADITVIEGRDIRPGGASPVGVYGQIYKITVTPAAEASPAFKYRFTVPLHQTIPGNAITHYLRSLGENGLTRPWDYWRKETDWKIDDWYGFDTPASDIPIEDLKRASEMFDSYISNHLRRATICRDIDWGLALEDLRGMETIQFLLPSVQSTRDMARALLLQNRLALIENRFEDSVDRLRMIYQLGRNVNEQGLLVSSLVGLAEIGMANRGALLLASTDGSPNLYWALAELPAPVADMQKAISLEASLPMRVFPELMGIENMDLSDDQWKKLLRKCIDRAASLSSTIGMQTGAPNPKPVFDLSLPIALAGYSNAKQRMIERGYSEDNVKRMSVSQVILMDAAMDIEYFSQSIERSWHVAPSHAERFVRKWNEEIQKEEGKLRAGAIIAGMLAPAFTQVRQAQLRTQAEINVLMAIESIRNHAAIHAKLPDSLDDLDLPVRLNPINNKPFNYSLENNASILTLDTGNGRIIRYEISIKK